VCRIYGPSRELGCHLETFYNGNDGTSSALRTVGARTKFVISADAYRLWLNGSFPDRSHSSSHGRSTLTETLIGKTWLPIQRPASNEDGSLFGVSCATASLCVSVGNASDGIAPATTTVQLGSVYQPGTTWLVGTAGSTCSRRERGPVSTAHYRELGVHVDDIVGMVTTNSGHGYDLVGSDGGVFVFPSGESNGFFGSLPGIGVHVNDIVGIVAAPDGTGYLLVGSDGGVFAFGPKGSDLFHGSLPGIGVHVNNIVSIAATSDSGGYTLVGSSGSVYAFGYAQYFGMPPSTRGNVSDIVPTPGVQGYWLIVADGGVFDLGETWPFEGSLPGLGISVKDIVGAVPTG
jgi:hypothetical protein